jgi:hypothetical protein
MYLLETQRILDKAKEKFLKLDKKQQNSLIKYAEKAEQIQIKNYIKNKKDSNN